MISGTKRVGCFMEGLDLDPYLIGLILICLLI